MTDIADVADMTKRALEVLHSRAATAEQKASARSVLSFLIHKMDRPFVDVPEELEPAVADLFRVPRSKKAK